MAANPKDRKKIIKETSGLDGAIFFQSIDFTFCAIAFESDNAGNGTRRFPP